MNEKDVLKCLNCGESEMDVPVVAIRYAGTEAHICSQCLPILIHESEQLALKLKNMNNGS